MYYNQSTVARVFAWMDMFKILMVIQCVMCTINFVQTTCTVHVKKSCQYRLPFARSVATVFRNGRAWKRKSPFCFAATDFTCKRYSPFCRSFTCKRYSLFCPSFHLFALPCGREVRPHAPRIRVLYIMYCAGAARGMHLARTCSCMLSASYTYSKIQASTRKWPQCYERC